MPPRGDDRDEEFLWRIDAHEEDTECEDSEELTEFLSNFAKQGD